MFPLTLTHLRFTVEALTPLRLDGWRGGSNLRGALGNVMRRAYCPEAYVRTSQGPTPGHAATCPVCWLLAANEKPGQERRGYALVPPASAPEVFQPGERFSFGLTLFGDALRFLPYWVLAVPEAGRAGVGPARGQYALRQVLAADPLSGQEQTVLAEGESLVHAPALAIMHSMIEHAADEVEAILATQNGEDRRITLNFLTPTRLTESGALRKTPDFDVFFARLLDRLDELNEQFAGGAKRGPEAARALQMLAEQVRMVDTHTQWVEVRSGSSRSGQSTWISGLVGHAVYSAPADIWKPLLPWLLWGQAIQVGKDVVKGNGWYEVVAPGLRRYGRWIESAVRSPVSLVQGP